MIVICNSFRMDILQRTPDGGYPYQSAFEEKVQGGTPRWSKHV